MVLCYISMQFESKTQFDDQYKSLIKERSSCSVFSLMAVEQFLQNKKLDKEQHAKNIYNSVANFVAMDINGHISFGELLTHIIDHGEGKHLSETDTMITNVDFLLTGETKFEDMFPDSEEPYGEIFLKDTKFFTVLYKDGKFYVRDSHHPFQYCFDNRELLKDHLNNQYQFNSHTVLSDGTTVHEFSVIEYLKIDKPFKTVYTELSVPQEVKDEVKKEIDPEVDVLLKQLNDPNVTQNIDPETISAIHQYLMSNFDIDEIGLKEIEKKKETTDCDKELKKDSEFSNKPPSVLSSDASSNPMHQSIFDCYK